MKKIKTFWDICVSAGMKLARDNIGAYSAQAAFFLLTSIFPFIMLLLSLLQFFPFGMDDLISAASAVLPRAVEGFVVPVITEIYAKGTPTLISVAAITALWSASTGVNAMVNGIRRICDADKADPWIKLRLVSIVYMLGLIVVIILSLGLSVFGSSFVESLIDMFPHVGIFRYFSQGVRLFCSMCLLTLIFDLIYLFTPLRKSNFVAQLPGAVLAAAGWIGFSHLYSFYIDNLANFSVYGSLAMVVFFMLWMYVCFYILFVGAEINVFLQNARSKRRLIEKIKAS